MGELYQIALWRSHEICTQSCGQIWKQCFTIFKMESAILGEVVSSTFSKFKVPNSALTLFKSIKTSTSNPFLCAADIS